MRDAIDDARPFHGGPRVTSPDHAERSAIARVRDRVRDLDRASGEVVDLESASATASPRGVEIRFRPTADPGAPERSVFYFAQDLSNEGLASSPGYGRWLRNAPFNTYMKSAEYLPHMEGFESFDQLVLDRSPQLREWAPFLEETLARVPETYVYANNHYAGHGPATIRQLQGLVRTEADPS